MRNLQKQSYTSLSDCRDAQRRPDHVVALDIPFALPPELLARWPVLERLVMTREKALGRTGAGAGTGTGTGTGTGAGGNSRTPTPPPGAAAGALEADGQGEGQGQGQQGEEEGPLGARLYLMVMPAASGGGAGTRAGAGDEDEAVMPNSLLFITGSNEHVSGAERRGVRR